MCKILSSIETSLGTLRVRESGFDPGSYPGFVVEIERNGKVFDFALLEVDQERTGREPVLKAHIWDTVHDDPIFDYEATANEIDKFNEEVNG